MMHGRFPTEKVLQKGRVMMALVSVFCHLAEETLKNIFLHYPMAKALWLVLASCFDIEVSIPNALFDFLILFFVVMCFVAMRG